jgi:hypothetical protein
VRTCNVEEARHAQAGRHATLLISATAYNAE